MSPYCSRARMGPKKYLAEDKLKALKVHNAKALEAAEQAAEAETAAIAQAKAEQAKQLDE